MGAGALITGNKVIVITGGSSGIGAALAEHVTRDAIGHTVVLVARRAAPLEAIAEHCHGRAHVIAADVTDRAEVRRVVAEAVAAAGHIDVWVNNVGQGITRTPIEVTDEDIDAMIKVNVKSALYGMQEVLPHFRKRGTGHIINISSMLGRIPHALGRSVYSASKHFLNALTENFRRDVQETHPDIQVSLVSPGVVYTAFGNNAVHGGPDSRAIPGGQMPEGVAEVIAGVIESRAPDVYTAVGSSARVAAYYAGVGVDP